MVNQPDESFPAESKNEKGHDEHTPHTLRSLQRPDYIYPKAPSPTSVVEIDGVESIAKRTPLRYEMLEDVLDELPDFARETICSAWGDKLKTN